MKKKIAILGSTGSIGESTLNVINKNKKDFDVVLLSANKNYKKLFQQAKKFKVKNIIINDKYSYEKVKKIIKKKNIKVFSTDIPLNKIVSKKIDLTMSAIVGLAGLQPTIDAIKISKRVALANKESIICGWNILNKIRKKQKTKLIPVDCEHFSIMELIQNYKDDDIEEIIITASGGPFLNTSSKKLNFVKAKEAV